MKRIGAALLLMLGCSREVPPPAAPPAPPLLSFQPPAAWTKEAPASKMRLAQYRVPDKEKKDRDAELALFYFGNSPSMIEANIARWAAQVEGSKADQEKFKGRCEVTLVDLKGTYTADAGGAIPGARMLAAVVETSEGPWYLKLVGPAGTVGDWREEFVALLKEAALSP